MKVEFTLRRFPINGRLKEQCGLPFSAVLQPYARLGDKEAAPNDAGVRSDAVARCSSCYSYINCYCSFDAAGWVCSLCNKHNALRPQQLRRYRLDPAALQLLPEVSHDVFEALAEEPIAVSLPPRDPGYVSGPAPVVVALVDVSGGEEFLELVRSSLEAALEALPPVTRFALITFSNRIGLHDVRGEEPCVRYVQLLEQQQARSILGMSAGGPAAGGQQGGGGAVGCPLAEVLPLGCLLAPVGRYKGAITRALEEQMLAEGCPDGGASGPSGPAAPSPEGAMQRLPPGAASGPAAPGAAAAGGPGGSSAAAGGSRGLGPALLAVLDYLKVLQGPPFVAQQAPGLATSASVVGADHLPHNQSPIKLLNFLAGVPDYGIGRLINPRRRRQAAAAAPPATDGPGSGPLPSPDPDAWLQDVPSTSVEFYEQAAAACASLGVCVDLFAVCPGALGLRHLQPLCAATGGAVYLYPAVDDSAMPQDVYLRLGSPCATAAILRVRTTPHFKAVRHYGRLLPDPAIPDLHHVVAADPSDAFAVDFDFSAPAGFAGASTSLPPTLQVAFQYTTLVCEKPQAAPGGHQGQGQGQGPNGKAANGAGPGPAAGGAAGSAGEGGKAEGEGDGRRYWLQRRLRVATYRVMTAATVADVYAHANSDAVVTLLMHKIMRAAETQGPHEARLLLRDWLVILAINYHRNVHAAMDPQQLATVPADLHFTQAPLLAPLPRLVYALLRSPLLAPPGEGQHPDLTAFLRHLWASLPPPELVRAVYPLLSSYADPDTPAYPRHSLSRAALGGPAGEAAGPGGAPPIFLLDAYILILVYYTSRCPPGVPFPPPQQSALRRAVAAIRAERRITPQIKFLREGGEDAELFEQLLLDEPDGHDGGSSSSSAGGGSGGGAGPGGQQGGGGGFGLVQFVEHVQQEAALQLQQESAQGQGQGGR